MRAFEKAIELNPQDYDARQSLANVLEFNRAGVRYAPDAQLGVAIAAYRYVQEHQPVLQAEVMDNLAIDLFYAGGYDDAVQELTGIPGTTERFGIILASIAASKGAADLLTASLPDTTRGAAISAKLQLFRNLKPFVAADLPASDPRQPVQRLMEWGFAGTLDEALVKALVSRHSYGTDAAWVGALRQRESVSGSLLALMKQTGLPRAVIADIVLSRMSVTAAPGSAAGVPVRVQVIGLAPIQFFLLWPRTVHGGLPLRVETPHRRARRRCGCCGTGKPDVAKSLLNWDYSLLEPKREVGDPLSGDLFARLWEPSARAGEQEPLLAATALTREASLLRPLEAQIVEAEKEAPAGERQIAAKLLLATVALRLKDASNSVAITSRLLAEYPDSDAALELAGKAYGLERNWVAWKALLAKRLKAAPGDRQLLLDSATEAEAEGDTSHARESYQQILDGAHASSEDYTMYAWLSMVEGKLDDKALAAAQQATMAGNGRKYQSLLTLACLHAARGETAEAHQELLDAMSSANLDEPDAEIWYGFGRIYEQYGVDDAAASAYERAVQMADAADAQGVLPRGVDISTLARVRLGGLKAK